ncbi:hypothetical protein F2Q70_00031554 [Brassica cretica]|uniref:Uncharacterized protein n=1 Tax=Brassica cretica TaxID=69181 RepID=A0A8S9FDL5_BRACR|nr:hypothetical protein F2Q70_00031554 [Brassica cretica]
MVNLPGGCTNGKQFSNYVHERVRECILRYMSKEETARHLRDRYPIAYGCTEIVELTTYMDPSTSSIYRVEPAIADKTDEDLSHEEFKNTMKGAVRYVKNQGSYVAAVEAINKTVTGNLTTLSEQ